jgi:hypothetical protein
MNRIILTSLVTIIILLTVFVYPVKKAESISPLVGVVAIYAASATTAYVSVHFSGQAFAAASAEISWKTLPLSKLGNDKGYVLVTEDKIVLQKLKQELGKKGYKRSREFYQKNSTKN